MCIERSTARVFLIAALLLGAMPVAGLVTGPDAFGTAYAAGPYSLWPAPVTPGFAYDDPSPIEMGLRFRSDVAGYVTGVRFFKAPGATGTHIGRLWTTDQVKLAEVTFTGETASGWQTATFPTAVQIQANTTYIIAYAVADGNRRFSDTFDFFAAAGVDNAPLHALRDGEDGANGSFSETGGWFNQTYKSSNYWVDVVFEDSAPPPDVTPPTVASVIPAADATGVLIGSNVSVTFSEPMDAASFGTGSVELRDPLDQVVEAAVTCAPGSSTATLDPLADLAYNTVYSARVVGGASGVRDVAGNPLATDYTWTFTCESPDLTPPTVVSVMPVNGVTRLRPATRAAVHFSEAMDEGTIGTATFELRDAANALVPATVAFDPGTFSATLTPLADLARGTTYTARVKGGATGVKDAYGNALAADYTWSFGIVGVRPPVDQAPGGPILVIASGANLYTRYFTEILRAEGLNEFDITDIADLTPGMLAAHDVAILGDMALTAGQVGELTDWVTAGGRLVAMHPDKQLEGLLGLADAATTLSNGYVLIDTSRRPGAGIVGQTLQFHGIADAYTLDGATSLASLYSDRTTSTPYPAVTLRAVGSHGGVACAFTFDLAKSIVWTHQGNPAWQNDHVNPLQSYGTALDLFYPDWVDFNRITIPQADEQQRFLANLILFTNADRKPLPRFWYLPKGKKAAIILTGDDHWGISSPSGTSKIFFDRHKQLSTPGCSPNDWECIRSSSYGFDGALMTDQEAADYTAQGFEFGLHADAGLASGQGWCGAWGSNMPEQYNAQLEPLMRKYGSIPVQSSERSHCYSWFGYTGAPGWLSYAGTPEVEVNLDIHMDTNISYNPAEWATVNPGYQMGSGMMMRFAQVDPAGAMTKFLDIYNAGTQMNDDNGQGAAVMRTIVDGFLDNATGPQGYYGGFCVNMHSDNWYGWSYDGSDQIVASAQAHGIPVVSGRQMVDWLDGRNSSSFGSIAWDGTTMGFTVAVGTGARNLMGMIPAVVGVVPLAAISRDGQPVAFTVETIKGTSYAFFPATTGAYAAVYTPDTTAPLITGVTAHPTSGQGATIVWTTSEPATSRVDYGTNPSALSPGGTDPQQVTQHTVSLSGLLPNTAYYYRVVSADASGNTATSPDTGLPAGTFTTPSASLVDMTVADFSAGSAQGVYVGQVADGEVLLAPAVAAEFSGTALPAGWSIQSGAGTATVNNGTLTLNGATVGPSGLLGPGHSLEAVATFTSGANQHIGFAVTLAADGGDAWAIISTGGTGTGLLARCWTGSGGFDTQSSAITGSFLGSPHRYRVDWNANSIDYYVDGVKVATHNVTIPVALRPLLSVGAVGAASLAVDWVHVTPYTTPGVFTSRVMDARGPAAWEGLSWNCDLPSGTSLAMNVRTGDVPAPNGTWTAFAPVATSGDLVGGQSRYIQYQATLASTDANVTPLLRDVSILYSQGQVPPPEISSLAADPVGTQSATIQWTTDVPATSRVDYGTSAGALVSSVVVPALVQQHAVSLTGLQPGTTYFFRVTSADGLGQATVAPAAGSDPASFTTRLLSFMDLTAADFGAGSLDVGVYVSLVSDGEVMLAPVAAAEFTGTSLPSGWSVQSGSGTVAVSNGALTVSSATVGTNATYGPGHSVEAVGTFTAGLYEHIGFGVTLSALPGDAWAIISTGSAGTGLFARCWTGTGAYDTQITAIPGSYFGTQHRYRIDWSATAVTYYVDGALVATHSVVMTNPMRAMVSVGGQGTAELTVDWVHVSPYTSPGVFTSRVFDAGAPSAWQAMSWTPDLPDGTALAMGARTGNVPVPDATWTSFAPVATSGSVIGGTSRYVQYRASLATSDPALTPALRDVQILYNLAQQTAVMVSVPAGTWITTATPCVTVPVELTRTEASPARAISVRVQLGPQLRLCDPAVPKHSIRQGSWLGGFETSFQVVDRGNGLYQVDQSILGDPCGITTGGTLFTLDVTNTGADGTGALTVTQVSARDCANATLDFAPGAAASLVVDRTPPAAVTDLAASGNGGAGAAAGTRKIALAFTVPGDAAAVEVYRAPFGSYPLYARLPGTGQAPPAPTTYPLPAPWVQVAGLAGPGSDDPGARDFWYHVVVTKDAHGNATISGRSAGALDYVLGDVHDGSQFGSCVGDNRVTLSDISYLGDSYGLVVPTDASYACLDVGPTTDYALSSRPVPDGLLDFEDLVLFALDYGITVGTEPATLPAAAHVAPRATPAAASATQVADALALTVPALPGVGERFEVGLAFEGHGTTRALSVELAYDPAVVEPVGVVDGELLTQQASPHVTLSAHAGNVAVALLGGSTGLTGRGELAKVAFRVVGAGEAKLSIRKSVGRDAANQATSLDGMVSVTVPVRPGVTALSRAMPTPFRDGTTFELALSRSGPAHLAIYGVTGRRIRTLVAEAREAGVYRVAWDGRDDAGNAVAPGMYFARLASGGTSITRTVVRVR